MGVIQIGSLAILVKWLILGVAILFGLIFIKIWLQRSLQAELSKKVFDVFSNSIFIGFFIWKGSLLLIDPLLVLKSPFSLLYFTGGSNGLTLAILFSFIYVIFKSRKSNISSLLIYQSVFIFSLTVMGVYHLLCVFFLDMYVIFHFLLGSLTMVLLIWSLLNNSLLLQRGLISNTILFSFLNLILSFAFLPTDNRLSILSMEQWLFIGLIILSLFLDNKSKNTNS